MFGTHKLLLLLATAALLTACGGGGGGGDNPPRTGSGSDVGGSPTDPVGEGPTDPTDPTDPVADDQVLSGHLQVSANQVVFIPADRNQMYGFSYNAGPIEYFEETGLDIAAGGTDADLTAEIPPSVVAPAAPIANFGFRVLNELQNDAGGVQTGAQTAIGRVALNFVERPDSAGILAGEQPERMRFIIDRVEMATDASGTLITARALDDAQVYVDGMNAAGTTVQDTLPAAANSVRLMPLSYVADNYGDTSAQVLMVDPEYAFSQAGTRLQALHALRGEFDMQVTFSSVKMIRPSRAPGGSDPALEQRELIGPTIQMSDHAPVNGAGVSGKVWIRR